MKNRNMASETLLIFVLMMSSVWAVKYFETHIKLKCQPALGLIGQITHISCSIEPHPTGVIRGVVLTRSAEIYPFKISVTGDSRFEAENLPSLQLHNTAISDEGEYKYFIQTSMGTAETHFTINVTDPHNPWIEIQKHNCEMCDLPWSSSDAYRTTIVTLGVGVLVIACLMIGLLLAVKCMRRCVQPLRKAQSLDLPGNFNKDPADTEEEKALNESV